jgi:hypothetical protein
LPQSQRRRLAPPLAALRILGFRGACGPLLRARFTACLLPQSQRRRLAPPLAALRILGFRGAPIF